MIIKKRYERLVNLGNYENVKVGIELEQEIAGKTPGDIKKMGLILGQTAEAIVLQEVEKIKQSKGENNESRAEATV